MAKPFRNINRARPQSCGLGFLVVFILVSLSYVTMSRTNKMRASMNSSQLVPVLKVSSNYNRSDDSTGHDEDKNNQFGWKIDSSSSGHKEAETVKNNSSSIRHDEIPASSSPDDLGAAAKPVVKKPICDLSNRKSDVCEADGDVRIIGKNTRMVYVSPSQLGDNKAGDSWTIKPYARKWDEGSGASVRPVTLKLVNGYGSGDVNPHCSVNYSVPALVFAIGGWSGINFFHDFGDVLVPLFQAAYPFAGEVQLLVANKKPGWVEKYQLYFKSLSKYDIIEFDKDDAVRCFKHVTLGLRCSSIEDFQMEPSKSPQGYSMVDFARFTRSAFSLERDHPTRLLGQGTGAKPRLMIITRATTRKFMNVEEIVAMARELGFDTVVTEADENVAKFSRIVNSCDVLMGVHGSALTNMVFLPTNGVIIQVVPWGNLDWIAGHYFRDPSKQMKVNYLEYSINEEETTLSDQYPRDHAVFKDPMSVHHQGWDTFSRIFLKEQNVRLDVKRFRPFLERALEILREQQME